MKITITEQQYKKLIDEELSSGTFLIYHRTKIKDPKMLNSGFIPGEGDFYGRALYGCYDFQEQLKPDMSKKYGDIIVEFQVPNNGKFLIYDTDENIKLNGRYVPFKEQLRRLMGGDYSEIYANNTELIEKINNSLLRKNSGDFTGNEAFNFFKNLPLYIRYVDGFIYNGGNDGKTLVLYNINLAKALRYTKNEGKTWLNVLDKRVKNKDSYDKILSQHKSFNNGIKPYQMSAEYEKYKHTKDKRFVTPDFINIYLNRFPETERKEKLNEFLNNEKFLNKINVFNFKFVAENLPEDERYLLLKKIFKKNSEFMNSSDDVKIYDILYLLPISKRYYVLKKVLLTNKNFIKNLKADDVSILMRLLNKKDKALFVNDVFEMNNFNKNFLKTLNIFNVYPITKYLAKGTQIKIFRYLKKENII